MAPLAFTKENFAALRRQLVDLRGELLAVTKANQKIAKERAELLALVDEIKNHVDTHVEHGLEKLEAAAVKLIKKWAVKAARALERLW